MASPPDRGHHNYVRYMAWSLTAFFFIWFMSTLDLLVLLLGVIGVAVILREEIYVRMGVKPDR